MKADRIIKNAKVFTSDRDGFSNNKPSEVYFSGKKMN